MKYLKPDELQDWHIKIILEQLGAQPVDRNYTLALGWYAQWLRYATEFDPPQQRHVDELHGAFALARLRGTK